MKITITTKVEHDDNPTLMEEYAAVRLAEVVALKMQPICREVFRDADIDFIEEHHKTVTGAFE